MKKYRTKSKPPKTSLKNSLFSFLFFIFLISLQSCVSRQGDISFLASEQDKSRIFNQVREKWDGIQTLRGYFRITANIKGKQGSIKALLALTLPNNLRMELISPGGTTMAIMTLSQDMIKLYYPSENILFIGSAETENIIKVLGINLTPEEILPALMGKGFDLSKNPQRLYVENDSLIAEYSSKNGSTRFDVIIDPQAIAINGIKSFQSGDGSLFAEINYKDIVYKEDFAYPRLADLDFPQEDTSYRIKITNAEFLVSKLENKVFVITTRENVKTYRIEELDVRGTLLFGEK
jgi:outer membrane lipoprotein-sorting protein